MYLTTRNRDAVAQLLVLLLALFEHTICSLELLLHALDLDLERIVLFLENCRRGLALRRDITERVVRIVVLEKPDLDVGARDDGWSGRTFFLDLVKIVAEVDHRLLHAIRLCKVPVVRGGERRVRREHARRLRRFSRPTTVLRVRVAAV